MDHAHLKQKALSYVEEAAAFIKDAMKNTYGIDTKANKDDLVTDVDRNVEKLFIDKVAKDFPDHRLMGEEGSYKDIDDLSGYVWILDPIDGTVNFVHMGTYFAISLGIFKDGEPVIGIILDVMNDEWFVSEAGKGAELNGKRLPQLPDVALDEALVSFNTGWVLKDTRLQEIVKKARGTRSYGSAALEMAYVASGRIDAYISMNLAPWDVAGGWAVLKEVGGVATTYEGNELTFLQKDTLFAASPSIYKQINAHLK
ncbi:inositol monophosphatase family protein [Alkalicoccus luteus]|uniref:inositol-phosphate phosphatase n=1 Tax=Alkalicoccus luteus TaxID=1237094 RepID=A0A969PRQ6_9BACI|nr:inositol monophosphatase family protein [Alkalicoccus luteus]NJP39200.1 inositol monophosphatase family protein [Alkalicoccus luteus]